MFLTLHYGLWLVWPQPDTVILLLFHSPRPFCPKWASVAIDTGIVQGQTGNVDPELNIKNKKKLTDSHTKPARWWPTTSAHISVLCQVASFYCIKKSPTNDGQLRVCQSITNLEAVWRAADTTRSHLINVSVKSSMSWVMCFDKKKKKNESSFHPFHLSSYLSVEAVSPSANVIFIHILRHLIDRRRL